MKSEEVVRGGYERDADLHVLHGLADEEVSTLDVLHLPMMLGII